VSVGQGDDEGFARLYTDFMSRMITAAPSIEAPIVSTLRAHFNAEPRVLTSVSQGFPVYEQPNLQIALELWLSSRRRRHSLIGVSGGGIGPRMSFSSLLVAPGPLYSGTHLGSVDYLMVDIGAGEMLQCVQQGMYLVHEGPKRLAVFIRGAQQSFEPNPKVVVEVVAVDRHDAGEVLESVVTLMREKNLFRGSAISLRHNNYGVSGLDFHRLPRMAKDEVILSPGVLERIEAHTIEFSNHAKQLRTARRHLRRGLLLYGPPGTGKTLTVMYLAAQMTDRTTFLLAGGDTGIREA
jgi:hypothetical protein